MERDGSYRKLELTLFEGSEDEELKFEPPSFLDLNSLNWRDFSPFLAAKICRKRLEARPLYFFGNYRRALFFIVISGFLSLLGGYWFAQRFTQYSPLKFGVSASSLLMGIGFLAYFLFFYRKRGIAVDKFGIYYWDEYRELNSPWEGVKGIYLQAVEAFFSPYPLCYVRVELEGGDEFAFANYGPYIRRQREVSFGLPPYPIIDIKDADLLLPILIDYSKWAEHAPDFQQLRLHRQFDTDWEFGDDALSLAWGRARDESLSSSMGVGAWTLLRTLFLKWIPQMGKVLTQFANPGLLGLSVGIYSLLFSWQFALLLVSILLVHEFGHVWAMYQKGMQIRGIYLVPFIGAATVTDDQWKSWRDMAEISLAGPFWGMIFSAILLIVFTITGEQIWLFAAVLNGLINLLNLLPIQPLDGGRILYAIAYSISYSRLLFLPLLFLGLALLYSWMKGWVFLYVLCVLGLLEFFREYEWKLRSEKFIRLPDALNLSPRDIVVLKSITGINFGLNSSDFLLKIERQSLKKLRMFITAKAMSQREIITILMMTLLTFALLSSFLFATAEIFPSYQWLFEIFR